MTSAETQLAPVDPLRLIAGLRVCRSSDLGRLEQVWISEGKGRGRRPQRSHRQGFEIFQTPCGGGIPHLCMVSHEFTAPSGPCHLLPG